MNNAMTIDLEDWRQIVHRKLTGETIAPNRAVVAETETILGLLESAKARATFFVLGNAAEAFPGLVRRIHELGHEVASHGLSHSLVYSQTGKAFKAETAEAKERLEDLTGAPVIGYRAAEFSVTSASLWALEILAELGFLYDSSVFPVKGRRYGIPGYSLRPVLVESASGARIVEYPLTTLFWANRRWPVAGGGYFRLLPLSITRSAIKAANGDGRTAIIYLHPYEFSSITLRTAFPAGSARAAVRWGRYHVFHNLWRGRVVRRFKTLLQEFDFTPLREIYERNYGGSPT